jgi:hypothetical protein
MAMAEPQGEREQMLSSAFGDVVAASERVIVDRIDLARFDAVEALSRRLRGALLLSAGSVLIFAGWLGLCAGGVLILDEHLSLPLSLAAAGACNALVGMAVVAVGLRHEKSGVESSNGAASTENDERK